MEENLRHELYDAHDRVMTFLETLTLDGDPEIAQIEQEIIENYRSYPGKRPVGKEVLTWQFVVMAVGTLRLNGGVVWQTWRSVRSVARCIKESAHERLTKKSRAHV
jgi:hypothetical protein